MQHLRNLTLASAKHLLTQGHITPAHHARIVSSVSGAAAVSEMRGMEAASRRHKKPPAARGFGSLAQQAQAPIPATDGGPSVTPTGTASGY